MPQKTLIIVIAVFVILGVGILAGTYVLVRQDAPATEEAVPLERGVSPFGEGGVAKEALPRITVEPETKGAGTSETRPLAKETGGGARQLTEGSVAGKTFVVKNGKTFVRYMERGTGHIYDVGPVGENRIRLSQTTFPGIYETLWGKNGAVAVIRYEDAAGTIKTITESLSASTSTAPIEIKSAPLPDGIRHAAISPNGQIFHLATVGGMAVGTTVDPDGKNKKQVFTSPFSEWMALWINGNIALTTKPSLYATGSLYLLDPKNNSLQRILGNIAGLTALVSSDKKYALISKSDVGDFKTYLYDIVNKTTSLFPITTLPEKCAWAKDEVYCAAPRTIPRALYPDDWYQGVVSFSDDIWRIKIMTGAVDIVWSPERGDVSADATDLAVSEGGAYLIFTNKNDSTVWSVKLNKE